MAKTCLSQHRYSDLADEIKALKIENNILKDKIKASKRPVKVLVPATRQIYVEKT